MNWRLSRRRFGSLALLLALAGCAVPPGLQNQSDDSEALRTKVAHDSNTTAMLAPSGYDGPASALPATPASAAVSTASATDSAGGDTPLTKAEPISGDAPDISSFHQVGRASWYGQAFRGRRTASGERYDMHALTAAHRTLPLGSYVRVSVPATSKWVVVRINDRGPFARGRVIDLSYAAASILGLQHVGTARVRIEGLSSKEAKEQSAQMLAENSVSDH
ncbi:septal ring lytic transglycosylase RlpA family lipoprotein [Burkholderia sp. WAC0059]|uniref:septal ring lytic transglycosylase RlpA family protein n=1 Tax=Burkholderia sp. WAC0059 TaxID=2066022 RepID=UPI000C7F2A9D|nr:septal ring lytic transglycosylase RlpA family protein [Burkholderia sp. WAC0059]PLZ02288.1 septal ring lytic transglycosylase RlpA family lipoprotein [Burkholderia sp. WAC0059]